jgi:nucleoside-diphosphate-sugar epimerase
MILVTGGSGVVGGAVVRTLTHQGFEVVAPDRSSGYLNSLIDFLKVQPITPDSIVHLAAEIPASKGFADTIELADKTRRIDQIVVGAAQLWGIHVVYASGCSLYDNFTPRCHVEHEIIDGSQFGHYLQAKKDGEEAFRGLGTASILRVAGFRGAGTPTWALAGRFVSAAREGRAITVSGDGLDEVDLVDLADIAEAVVLAIRHRYVGFLNVASGKPIHVKDLASLVCEITSTKTPPSFVGYQDRRRYARFDVARAITSLGWQPKISTHESIREMLLQ